MKATRHRPTVRSPLVVVFVRALFLPDSWGRHEALEFLEPVLDQDDLRRRIVPVGARPRNVLSRATIAALPCIAASQSGVAPSSFTASASAPDTSRTSAASMSFRCAAQRRAVARSPSVWLTSTAADQPACSVAVARFWN